MSESKKSKKIKMQGVHLHPTAVAHELRAAAATSVKKTTEARGGARLTADAVNQAVSATERMLKEVGTECQRVLLIAKRKTITKDLLLDILKGQKCTFKGAVEAVKGAAKPLARKGSKDKPSRGARQPIAIASALKCVKEGIPLGQNAFRVSEDAKYAIAALARAYIRALGMSAGQFANAARRATVTGSDVAMATGCL